MRSRQSAITSAYRLVPASVVWMRGPVFDGVRVRVLWLDWLGQPRKRIARFVCTVMAEEYVGVTVDVVEEHAVAARDGHLKNVVVLLVRIVIEDARKHGSAARAARMLAHVILPLIVDNRARVNRLAGVIDLKAMRARVFQQASVPGGFPLAAGPLLADMVGDLS